jgi:cytochrome c oxidase accessory protein FixG
MPRTISLPVIDAKAPQEAAASPLMKPEGRVLATLEDDGRRRWLRPKPSPGAWWKRRIVAAWALIALYTVIPWIKVAGMPMVLLDVVDRKFVFFGSVFRPTETLLFGVLFLAVFTGFFLLTALFGRVWCGWACPQTVYMEFVYRPLERACLGRAYANAKHAVSAWRYVAMYAAFLVVSAHLANTLLAWFVGADRLTGWIFTSSPARHPTAFAVFAAVTLLMMFDFAFFREQLCSLVCPYGRFQSALLDRDSLVVGYDRERGEPRGRKDRHVHVDGACEGKCGCDGRGGCGSGGGCAGAHEQKRGDCVDCKMCVQTCPAGIDIRDGMQLECIACTQCIDACDSVMTKLGRPTGLIRYTSQAAVEHPSRAGVRKRVRARLVVYPSMLVFLLAVASYLLATREAAAVAVLRTQGTPYVLREAGTDRETVESFVRMRIDNRTRAPKVYLVTGGEDVRLVREERVEVAGDASREIDVVVKSDPADFDRGRRDVTLRVDEQFSSGHVYHGNAVATVIGPLVIRPLAAEGNAR